MSVLQGSVFSSDESVNLGFMQDLYLMYKNRFNLMELRHAFALSKLN